MWDSDVGMTQKKRLTTVFYITLAHEQVDLGESMCCTHNISCRIGP